MTTLRPAFRVLLLSALVVPALAAHASAQGYKTGGAKGRAAVGGLSEAAQPAPERPKLVHFEAVHFAEGSARLEPGSLPALDHAAKSIKSDYAGAAQIRIEGHACEDGVPDEAALSDQRARVVRDYLVAAGVPEGRLDAVGRGGASPVANADPELRRILSRRVEFAPVAAAAEDEP